MSVHEGHTTSSGSQSQLHASPNNLPAASRAKVAAALDAVLADGLDLHGGVKSAHWNLKGPHFPGLHLLFETIAGALLERTDEIAERAVTLGGRAHGTARHVAEASNLPAYPEETTRDLEHVRLVAERVEGYLEGLRAARDVADQEKDQDTVDLLTGAVEEAEKHGWMLRATLGD